MNNYVTEEKLVEIMLAISDEADHDRIQGLLKVISEREADLVEVGRHLHNAWRGNKDLREELEKIRDIDHPKTIIELKEELDSMRANRDFFYNSLNSEKSRGKDLVRGYQNNLRTYMEDAAEFRATIVDLEGQIETLDNPSLPDEPRLITGYVKTIKQRNAAIKSLNADIDRRDKTIQDLTDQLLDQQAEATKDFGPDPTR